MNRRLIYFFVTPHIFRKEGIALPQFSRITPKLLRRCSP
jgi:hypothetical protein